MLKYPNLEQLENIAASLYQEEDSFLIDLIKDKRPDFEAYMFPQTWGSTALGFDGGNDFCGQAITQAYTTVFHELNTNTFVVLFNDKLAYMVYNPSEIFYADLAKQKLQSVRLAKKLY